MYLAPDKKTHRHRDTETHIQTHRYTDTTHRYADAKTNRHRFTHTCRDKKLHGHTETYRCTDTKTLAVSIGVLNVSLWCPTKAKRSNNAWKKVCKKQCFSQ